MSERRLKQCPARSVCEDVGEVTRCVRGRGHEPPHHCPHGFHWTDDPREPFRGVCGHCGLDVLLRPTDGGEERRKPVPRFRVTRAGTLTKRETTLSLMRVAGYENDRKAWMRLYVENAVSMAFAEEAWKQGRNRARKEGRP